MEVKCRPAICHHDVVAYYRAVYANIRQVVERDCREICRRAGGAFPRSPADPDDVIFDQVVVAGIGQNTTSGRIVIRIENDSLLVVVEDHVVADGGLRNALDQRQARIAVRVHHVAFNNHVGDTTIVLHTVVLVAIEQAVNDRNITVDPVPGSNVQAMPTVIM